MPTVDRKGNELMKAKKNKRKMKYWILGVSAVLAAVLIPLGIFLAGKMKLARAFDPTRYTKVKIVAWEQSVEVNGSDSGFTDEEDDSYVPGLPEAQRFWTQVRDGDQYYCNGPYGEVYCTAQDTHELYFDFESLGTISAWNLEKSGDYYVCKDDAFEIFCDFMGFTNRKNYSNCTLEFQLEDDRISNIRITYFYKLERYTVLEYSFEYTNETVVAPTESLGGAA